MRMLFILGLCFLAYISFTRTHPLGLLRRWFATAPATAKSATRVPDPQQILHNINHYRQQHGVSPLRYSTTCQAAARIQAEYNAANGTWSHDNADLPVPGDRLREAGHEYESKHPRWAENVFRYTLSRDKKHSPRWHVFHRYHISPPHDAEMLDSKVTRFGTASVIDDGVLYNTEVFAN